jgi:UDP:flavonoid glycosyltransferase YjiC (YdhE family)
VVAGGGYTLMSEAVYLHKPLLSIPVEGQFEQVINALYLEKLGYGMYTKQLTLEALKEFLARVPACQESLKGYTQDGNKRILEALREQLARAYEHRGHWRAEMSELD